MLRLSLPPKVAITGGIASGKSTVCHFFKELGALVLSADSIVHGFLTPSSPIGKQVISLLGDDIVKGENIEREAVAKLVFNNPPLLKQLEDLLHPEVQKVVETTYQKLAQSREYVPLFIVEVPLLYESSLEEFYDYVLYVEADEARCQARFVQTTDYSEKEFLARKSRLLPAGEKRKKADYILENNKDLQSLKRSVNTIFNLLVGNRT